MLPYLGAVLAMFIETFLRGFQNKNVQQDFVKAAVVCGFLMALMDALVIGFIVDSGFKVAIFAAFGSGLGWAASMKMHKYVTRKHRQQLKAEKKAKRQRRIEKIVISVLSRENKNA